jgi:proteic killer suppression protein
MHYLQSIIARLSFFTIRDKIADFGIVARKPNSGHWGANLQFARDRLNVITSAVIMTLVIRSFWNRGSQDVFDGCDTPGARRACPSDVWRVAQRKLDQINRVRDLLDLAVPPGNRLERLRGDRSGQHSIRINEQYRICFRWETGDAYEVEITDYH